jgi:hypothetical protein
LSSAWRIRRAAGGVLSVFAIPSPRVLDANVNPGPTASNSLRVIRKCPR